MAIGLVSRPILVSSGSLGFPSVVLPPMPPYVSPSNAKHLGLQVMPLGMKLAGDADYWYFSPEPYVGISGANTINRRSVAKTNRLREARGTVKESWAQDDHRINITGYLRNWDDETAYPREAVASLRRFCESRAVISVICPLLEVWGITQMVIDSYDIPHTAGEDMQQYTITAYSDFQFELLIENK